MKGGTPFEPKIVGFLCTWCAYAGADKAGGSQLPVPPNLVTVRLMCTGRMDPQFVVRAFAEGADGILILGCHPGDCHYKEQNYRAVMRHRLFLRMLDQLGIERERCRMDFVGASESEKFVRVATETVDIIRSLGPMRESRVTVG